jgi:Ca2+-binding RTX toxin-like protein
VLDFNSNGFAIRLDMAGGNDQALLRDSSSKSTGATLFGGSGDDTLTSEGSGSFVLNGSAGNDTLISSPDASDKLIGGPGTDTADYSARKRALRITLDNQPNDGQSGEHDNVMSDVENVIGGSGNDRIIGSPFNNSLVGGGGNDTIYGGAGNDTLVGGPGHDLLFGQDGNDLLVGKDGVKDSLDGGSGSGVDKATRDNGPSVFDIVKNIEAFI